MADRTSAEIFGNIFKLLAKDKTPDLVRMQIALQVWRMAYCYDFDPCQMDADEALERLGLAKRTTDEEFDEDTVEYASKTGKL